MCAYDYICPICKKQFERDFPMGEAPQMGVTCPRCGADKAEKCMGTPFVSWVVYPHNNPFQNRHETHKEREIRMETAGGKYIE